MNRASALAGIHVAEDGRNVVVRQAAPDEIAGWDALLARFGNRRLFQSTSWIRSIEDFSGARPLFLVFEKRGAIVGCLPGFLVRRASVRIFGSPFAGWQTESMGPAFDPERISCREMIGALMPFLRRRYGVQHAEIVSAHLDACAMAEAGFRALPQVTYRVALTSGEPERALRNASSNLRQNVRKAVREGLTVRRETDETFVDEFYDQTSEVFTRRGASVPFSKGRTIALFRRLRESGNLLTLSARMPGDDACAAAGLFLMDGRELCLWGWAHRTRFGWYCPSELLTWAAIQQAMEAGCVSFDMGGGGRFKEKFGAVRDETSQRYIWSRYQAVYWLRGAAERAFRLQQSARGWARRRLRTGHDTGPARRGYSDA